MFYKLDPGIKKSIPTDPMSSKMFSDTWEQTFDIFEASFEKVLTPVKQNRKFNFFLYFSNNLRIFNRVNL